MIAFTPRPVPDRVAVEIADQNTFPAGNGFFIVMYGLPDLGDVLSIRVGGVVGPDGKKVEAEFFVFDLNGNDHFQLAVMPAQGGEPETAIRKYAEPFVSVLSEPEHIRWFGNAAFENQSIGMFAFRNDQDIRPVPEYQPCFFPKGHIAIPGDDLHAGCLRSESIALKCEICFCSDLYYFLQDFYVNISKPVNVKTSHSCLVLTQFLQQGLVLLKM
jgi:hypothetical protein